MAIVLVHVQHQASGVCVGLPIMEWVFSATSLKLTFAHIQVFTAGIANFMNVMYRKLSIYDILQSNW